MARQLIEGKREPIEPADKPNRTTPISSPIAPTIAPTVTGLQQQVAKASQAPQQTPGPAPQAAPQAQAAAAPADIPASGQSAGPAAQAYARPGTQGAQQALFARQGARLGAFDPRLRTGGQESAAIAALLSGGGPQAIGAGGAPIPPSLGFRPNQYEDEQRILSALQG